jgi:hypothetical protein
MSLNNRIIYSCQGVSIAPVGKSDIATTDMVHGVQSIGVTTNFNLEQVFELGQIEIYENIEGTPDVEVTLEKVLDGYPLMYLMASTGVTGTSQSGLVARAKEQCDLRLGIFDEAVNNIASASDNGGDSEVEVYCSGMYISNISYTFPVEGNCTESMTLVGNNKQWLTGANVSLQDGDIAAFDGTDVPSALAPGSGGVQRREDVRMDYSILPVSIYGTYGAAAGNGTFPVSDGELTGASGCSVHLQNVTISTDFSREDIFELGKKLPYYRPAAFPVEVTCEIEAIATSGDFVTALETGDTSLFCTNASGNNTQEETIYFALKGGMAFDLGTKNRLSSISYGGGDATGGNVSNSYSYSNFNSLDVMQLGHNSSGVMGQGGTETDLWATQTC